MSALTNKERDGLEDVFLSIHSHRDKYQKIKLLSSLLIPQKGSIDFKNLLKQAKIGLKETKISHSLSYLAQKKKHLSK